MAEIFFLISEFLTEHATLKFSATLEGQYEKREAFIYILQQRQNNF